jgi:hypothetical protein
MSKARELANSISAGGLDADLLDGQQPSYYTGYSDTAVANLVDSSPASLNTLNELAAALGDDASFSTTVTNSIASKLPLAGGTITGDILYNDNVKAQFGTSNDLEIYHDGTNSYIHDRGVGNLNIKTNVFRVYNAGGTEIMANFVQNSGASLYHDNAAKIATTATGIQVTGSVDFGNWTVTETGGSLYFAAGGVNKMKLDATGNLDVVGDVNSNATIS